MAKDIGVPGNTMASQLLFDTMVTKLGIAVLELDAALEGNGAEGTRFKSLTLRLPAGQGGEVLIVLRATVNGTAAVGFHAGDCVSEALKGLSTRLRKDTITWKEDQYG